MFEDVARRLLRAVFGAGADISAANPLPVDTGGAALEQGVATGGTNTTLVDNTKGWQVNIWENAIVSVDIVVAGIEYHRELDSNTADTLDFATHPLPALVVVAAGDPYTIRRVVSPGEVHIDPFTDATGANILPAAVRSTAIGSFKADKVHCHFAAPTSNPITIALDANAGAAYDKILHVATMGASQDMDYYFPAGAKFEAGDVITVAWTNDIGVVAWAVQIGWEE